MDEHRVPIILTVLACACYLAAPLVAGSWSCWAGIVSVAIGLALTVLAVLLGRQ